MKHIFYYNSGLFPYACFASAVHLGILPIEPFIETEHIQNLIPEDTGRSVQFYYMGTDGYQNNIYALWNAGPPEIVKKIICSFLEICGVETGEIYFLDTGLKGDLHSGLSVLLYNWSPARTAGIKMICRRLSRDYEKLTGFIIKSAPERLTKNAPYQIMLP